jgi:Domain of unknown function (DUF4124)
MPKRRLTAMPFALMLLWLVLPLTSSAEIYKWVDANGQVHFSDKKHAVDNAQRMDLDPAAEDANTNRLTLYPDADTILTENNQSPQGNSSALSAGNWNQGGSRLHNKTLIRFDLADLLKAVHTGKGKQVASATLRLVANTDDKIYGQGVNNQEAPGHSTLQGDNAFYLIPVHNSWDESTVKWADFYSSSHYTPSMIRKLPSIAADGSTSPFQDYSIDVNALLREIVKSNVRELTLEMKLQRQPAMAQVTFHSREAAPEKRPALVIELMDSDAHNEQVSSSAE